MSTKGPGKVFMIVGPSGVGKNTLITGVLKRNEVLKRREFGVTVSCTTRGPREGEVDGVDYHFITREEFHRRVEQGFFAEWAEVHGNFYGTPVSELVAKRDSGRDVVFDLDIQGAKQLKMKFPEFQMIFILPPSLAELKKRLIERQRGDSPEELEVRLERAIGELHQVGEADWFIQNGNLEQAVSFLYNLIVDLAEDQPVSMMRFRNTTIAGSFINSSWDTKVA